MEQGLRKAIDERKTRQGFRLRDASVAGTGLAPDAKAAGWDAIRDLSYDGRGA